MCIEGTKDASIKQRNKQTKTKQTDKGKACTEQKLQLEH